MRTEIINIPKKKKKIKVISYGLYVVLFIIIGTVASLVVYNILTRAASDANPQRVVLSNPTPTSMTISWSTGVTADVSVKYWVSGQVQVGEKEAIDVRESKKRVIHSVEINNLEPSTEYNFKIISNGKEYSEINGKAMSFKTIDFKSDFATPKPVYGTVKNVTHDDALIFLIASGGWPLSVPVASDGNWIADLSSVIKISDSTVLKVTDDIAIKIILIDKDGKGAIKEGKYSELFGGDGKLLSSVEIKSDVLGSYIDKFPPEAVVASSFAPTPTPTPTPIPTPTPTPTPTPIPTPTPTPTPTPSGRIFRYFISSSVVIDKLESTGAQRSSVADTSIKISNLSDTGFSVIWASASKEEGYISYGTSANNLSQKVHDTRDTVLLKSKYYSHQVDIRSLDPEKKYYFEVYSGEVKISGSSPMDVTTFATLAAAPPFKTMSGKIESNGTIVDGVVYLKIINKDSDGSSGESVLFSTTVDSTNSWIASIGNVRMSDGSDYFDLTDGDEIQAVFFSNVQSDSVKFETDNIDEDIFIIEVTQ